MQQISILVIIFLNHFVHGELFSINLIVPINYSTVPHRTLTDAQITPLPSGDTSFTVTLTLLPVPSPYSPEDLVIISTIDPPDAGPIV